MEDDILVDSINSAKSAVRTIQEKLYEPEIDPKVIFRITNQLNDYLDNLGLELNKQKQKK
jgi:hypothetical protein